MKHQSPIIDEAAEWLATLSDPSCTEDERHAFARWLTRSNFNVEEFLRISTLARRLEGSQAWPAADVDQLIAAAKATSSSAVISLCQMERDGQERVPKAGENRSVRRVKPVWALAAIVLIAMGIVLSTQFAGVFDQHSYTTGLGELRSVTMEDGSIVQLNAQSRIRAKFTAGERQIDLESGEAIFKVAKDPARPFRVSTGTADIIAVGTQFNVNSQSNRTVVTVLEGRVKVIPQHNSISPRIVLAVGEQAVIEPRRPIDRIARVDAAKVTGWTERRLYFEDTPLAVVANEFARYNSRTIRIADPALSQRRITGTFDSSDPAALLQFLQRYGDTAIDESSSGWIVGRVPITPETR